MARDEKLRAILDKKLILEDEKKMWQDAGFYIEEPAMSSALNWNIYTQSGLTDKMDVSVAREIRALVVLAWENKMKARIPPVKLSEDEEYRASIEARSNS